MTVKELENLPYLDLQRIFTDAFINDKAFLLEKIKGAQMRKLFESLAPEDKQYILSNHPRVFARTVEGFTWERREEQEKFSRTIDDIVQKTFRFGGGTSHNAHDPDRGSSLNPKDTSEGAKQEKDKLKKYAATSPHNVAHDLGQALQKGNTHLGATAKKTGVRFENRMTKSMNSVQGVAGGFKKILRGDTMTQVSGVLDILGSVAGFVPKAGPFIAAGCEFVNVILELAGAGGPSLQEQIGKMINDQTEEIKNYINSTLWNQEIGKLVSKLKAFQKVQRKKYIFMDTVLSGGSIPTAEMQSVLTLHGPLFDNPLLDEAPIFFRAECRHTSYDNNKRRACARLLFAYTGLATITDITNTKLVSVLAMANFHTAKTAVLASIKESQRIAKQFLGEIFTDNISKANEFSCNYACPLTVYDTGLLFSEEETQLILNYAVRLGINSQATLDSCRQQCGKKMTF